MCDFFDTEVQKILNNGKISNFYDYYTNLNFPYKDKQLKFNNSYINSSVLLNIPKNLYNLKIHFSIDKNSINKKIKGFKTGINLYKSNGIIFAKDYNLPKGFTLKDNIINDDFVKDNNEIELLINEKDKNSKKVLSLSPMCLDDKGFFVNKNGVNNWSSLDFEQIDEYTLKLFVTALPNKEDIDFNNLIVNTKFSFPIDKLMKK